MKQSGGVGTGRRGRAPVRIPTVPMEWMDPMSWRLPSGKALAEFALQAGFLAPLMVGWPRVKRKKPVVGGGVVAGQAPAVEKRTEEAPERSGSFRQTK